MEINEIVTFTPSDCPPRAKRHKASTQKALLTLPNFTAHVQVREFVFVASANGTIFSFLPEEPQKPTVLGSHDGCIHCLVYHPIWELLISASVDGVVKIWDPFTKYAQSNQPGDFCLQYIQAHSHAILCLGIIGDAFLTGSVDKTVRVWKVDYDRLKFGFNPWFNPMGRTIEFDGWVTALWTSGMPLVSAASDVMVGDNTGRLTTLKSICQNNEPLNVIELRLVKSTQKLKKQGIILISMIHTHNLQIISTTHGQVRIADSQGVNKFCVLENERSSNYKHLAWNPLREEIILVDSTGTLDIYDYRQDRILYSEIVQPDVKCISFNPSSEEILISGRYGCQLWQITRNTPYRLYEGHDAPIIGIYSYVLTEEEIPTLPDDSSSSRPTTSTSSLTALTDSEFPTQSSRPTTSNSAGMESRYSSAQSANYSYRSSATKQSEDDRYKDKVIVTCGQDSKVLLWSFDKFSMKVIQSFEEENGEIFSSTFIPSIRVVVTGQNTGEIAFHTLQRNSQEKKLYLKAHNNTVSCVKYVEFDRHRGPYDSLKYIITGGFDGKIGMCNITNYMRQYQAPYYEIVRQCYSCTVMSIIENPMNNTFISGAADGVIKVWDSRLNLTGTLEGHKLGITSLAIDGYFLFSACEDGEVIMWDTLSCVTLKSFTFHYSPLNSLRLIAKNGNIVSTDASGNIIVWNYTDSSIIFQYNRKNTDISETFIDEKEDEVYAGTYEGAILRVRMENPEDTQELPHGGLNLQQIQHHNSNPDIAPSPNQTPRLLIRGDKGKNTFKDGRDVTLEQKLRQKLESGEFGDSDDLDDVFHS